MSVSVRFLADVPQHVGQLAEWHHREWSALMPDWSLEEAREELAAHARCRTRPTTLVLLDGDALLGSVSLIDEDAPEFRDRGEPWLASLYVRPEARGRGYGRQLVQALLAHARGIGVERLYLFTPEHRDFYAALGWRVDAHLALRGRAVDLMSIAP